MIDHNLIVTTSETINATAAEVWKALTNKAMIKQYFFGTEAESEWKPGSSITFRGEWEGNKYEDKGTILEVEKEKMLQFDYWSSMSGLEDVPENYAIITYELSSENGATVLKVTQKGSKDEETYNHSIEGWKAVLKNLKSLLDGK